ncbi:hypothetical protein FB451DRAFT_1461984 [Mycena latifolia]|nr:hypothetical protein FB451DRAFT_1461984 [Mycena latifolia]
MALAQMCFYLASNAPARYSQSTPAARRVIMDGTRARWELSSIKLQDLLPTNPLSCLLMSTSTALVFANGIDHRVDEGQMRLTRGSLSDPATGRTLAQVYSHLSRTCELQANRAAHQLGRGPSAIANRIEAFFGTGQQREEKLEDLKLMKYALPCETVRTQVLAFKNIVTIVTRYNGTRSLFLRSKYLGRGRDTEILISTLWTRAEDDTPPRDWVFYSNLAAACLSDTVISSRLADVPPKRLGCVDTETGVLSVLEHLLITSERSADALALQYLTGILEMPTFWQQRGAIYIMTFAKILARVASVLKDLGLDSVEAKDDSAESEDVLIEELFDIEGIDSMASVILTGVLGWDAAYPKSQDWAETLLPRSYELANSADLQNIIPNTDGETMTIFIKLDDDVPPTGKDDTICPHLIGDLEPLSVNEPLDYGDLRSGSAVFSGLSIFPWANLTGRRFFRNFQWSRSRHKSWRLPQDNNSLSAKKEPKWRRTLLPGSNAPLQDENRKFEFRPSSPDHSSISGFRPGSPIQGTDVELSQMQNESGATLSDAPVDVGGKSIFGLGAEQSTVQKNVAEVSQAPSGRTALSFDVPGGSDPRFSAGPSSNDADFSQTPDTNEVTKLAAETSASSSPDRSSIPGFRPGSPVQGTDIELSPMQNQSGALLSDASVDAGGKSIFGLGAEQPTVQGNIAEVPQTLSGCTASSFDAPGGSDPRFSAGPSSNDADSDFSQTPDNEVTRLTVETSSSSSPDRPSIPGFRPGSPVQGNDIEPSQMHIVMSVAWLQAKKPRSQSPGFAEPSQAKV